MGAQHTSDETRHGVPSCQKHFAERIEKNPGLTKKPGFLWDALVGWKPTKT